MREVDRGGHARPGPGPGPPARRPWPGPRTGPGPRARNAAGVVLHRRLAQRRLVRRQHRRPLRQPHHVAREHPHRPLQPGLGRPDPHRVGVHPGQRPPDPGPHPAPGLGADPRQHHALHPRARLRRGLGRLGHHDRGPPGVQLPGPHRRQHPRQPGHQPGRRPHPLLRTPGGQPQHRRHRHRRELPDEPRPPVHRHPRPIAGPHLVPGGDPANPTACTADAAFTTRCAASTTPASSPMSRPLTRTRRPWRPRTPAAPAANARSSRLDHVFDSTPGGGPRNQCPQHRSRPVARSTVVPRAPRGYNERRCGIRRRARPAAHRHGVRAALLEVLETVEPLTVPPTRPGSETDQPALVTALADIEPDQLADVGGKALNLAELVRGGYRVPPGFCVTTRAYHRVTDHLDVRRALDDLAATPAEDTVGLSRLAAEVHHLVLESPVPDDVAATVIAAYRQMGQAIPVAVRSSATAEDLPVRQLRRPAGHLPQRGRRDARARRGAPVLGLAVDRPGRRLPRRAGHRPARGRVSPWWCSGWWTPRSPACCSPPTRSPADGARPSSTPARAWARRWCPAP